MEESSKNAFKFIQKFGEKMKIMLIVPEYPPYHIGGGGIVYKNLAEILLDWGHNVVVVWGYYPTNSFFEKVEKYKKGEITFYKIPEIPYPKSMPYLRTAMPPNLNSLIELIKIIKKEKPDIVHIHGYGLIFPVIGAFLCKIFNTPYIFTIHGYPKTPEKNIFVKVFWRLFEKIVMQYVLKNAEAITCVSSWLADDKRVSKFKNKIKIVYNEINIKEFKKKVNDEYDLKLPENAKILCSIGRISEMKGFHLVIKVLPKLLKKYKNLYYVIIGDDDGFKRRLEELIKKLDVEKNVIFTGYLTGEKKLSIIKKCDVFIVPSLWEPFGLVALEGLAMKKVVVTSGEGGLKEFLKDSKNVLFFDINNLDTLVDAISLVLDGKKSYVVEDFIEKFDWKNIVKEYVRIYKSIGAIK